MQFVENKLNQALNYQARMESPRKLLNRIKLYVFFQKYKFNTVFPSNDFF